MAAFGVGLLVDPPADYSVAFAAGDGPGALLRLTLHVRNPSRVFGECVTSNATAAVSYDGAAAGRAAVLRAEEGRGRGRRARRLVPGCGRTAVAAARRARRRGGRRRPDTSRVWEPVARRRLPGARVQWRRGRRGPVSLRERRCLGARPSGRFGLGVTTGRARSSSRRSVWYVFGRFFCTNISCSG